MLNVYRPVPRDLFAATPPVRSRPVLRFFTTWYEAIAGGVVIFIMFLLIAPAFASVPLMGLWLLAYVIYIVAMIAISRSRIMRSLIHTRSKGLLRALHWLVWGDPNPPRAHTSADDDIGRGDLRGLALIQILLALALTAAALVFVVTLGLSYRAARLPPGADVASWLLFVLPMMRVARYASVTWIIVLGALVIVCDVFASALVVGGMDQVTLRQVALHAAWLTLVSLLPAITLRSLSERRVGLTNAIEVVRTMTALAAAPEEEFANEAAGIIAERMGYDEVNVLLATSDDNSVGRGLRFVGASSDEGRKLVRSGYIIEKHQGITGWTAVHGEERIVNDVAHDPEELYYQHPSFPRTKAECTLPLTSGATIIGVLDIQSEQRLAFGDDDVELLRAIAVHLALSLDNAQRLRRARGLAGVTQRIARRLLSQQDLRAALEQVVMIARETLGADTVALYPCDPEDGSIGEPVVSGTFKSYPASAARVTERGDASAVRKALLVGAPRYETYSAHAGAELERSDFVSREEVQAAAILPLRVGAHTNASEASALGVIFVNYSAGQLFSPEYKEWCETLADLAALALQSAMLYQLVIEEERANTWIELHDGIGQDVSYGRWLLEQVLDTWNSGADWSPIDGEKLAMANQCIQTLQRQVNYLIEIWRDRDTSDMWRDANARGDAPGSLFADLEDYAALVRKTLDVRCMVSHGGDDSALSGSLRHDARMVAREAVYNAYRHGRAAEALIDAMVTDDELRLCIRDNGDGFDLSNLSNKAHGMKNMRRRTERHNGSFEPHSSRGPASSGTTITAVFRLTPTAAPEEARRHA